MAVKTIGFMLPWVDTLSANSNFYGAGFIARVETSIADRAITDGKALELNANIFDQQLNTTDSPTFAGLTVDTTTLVTDAANNRVGVGTTSPSSLLHVAGLSTLDDNIDFTTTDFRIGATTSDGSDNAQIVLLSGGSFSNSRGAYLRLAGNEHAEAGEAFLSAGSGGLTRVVAPGAGEVSLETGSSGVITFNNTSEIARFSGSNFGIGTTSPTSPLHVSGTGSLPILVETTANGGRIEVKAPIVPAVRLTATGGADYTVELSASYSEESMILKGGSGYKVLTATGFSTPEITNLYSNNTLAVTIDGSQNVGIGTTAPDYELDVAGTIYALNYRGRDTGFTVGGDTDLLGAALQLYPTAGQIRGYINGSQMFVQTSTGLGIGTTSPDRPLHVSGSAKVSGTSPIVEFEETDTTKKWYWVFDGNDFNFREDSTSAANTRFAIQAGGNVGVGTTSPDNKLHVVDTTNIVAKFENTTASGNVRTIYKTPSYEWNIGVNNTGGTFSFYDGTNTVVQFASGAPANSLYMDASGNVGVGNSSPSYALHIGDGTTTTVQLALQSTDAGATIINMGDASNAAAGKITYNNSTNVFTFVRAGSVDMTLDSTGLGLGTTNPQERLHVNGDVRIAGLLQFDGNFRNLSQVSSTALGMGFLGGTSSSNGASLAVYGGTHATLAGNMYLTTGGAASTGDLIIRNHNGTSFVTHMTVKNDGQVNMANLPTSSAGLSSGDLWNDSGTLKIV